MKKCRHCRNTGLIRAQRWGMIFDDYCDCIIGQELEVCDAEDDEMWADYYDEDGYE